MMALPQATTAPLQGSQQPPLPVAATLKSCLVCRRPTATVDVILRLPMCSTDCQRSYYDAPHVHIDVYRPADHAAGVARLDAAMFSNGPQRSLFATGAGAVAAQRVGVVLVDDSIGRAPSIIVGGPVATVGVVGYCLFQPTGARTWHLTEFGVHSRYTGKGHGHRMLRLVTDLADVAAGDAGGGGVVVWVRVPRDQSHLMKMYAAHGFVAQDTSAGSNDPMLMIRPPTPSAGQRAPR
jgi:ribosomal protein S18 acetylase RimI-like enzyme